MRRLFASANDLVVNAGGTPPYLLKIVAQGRMSERSFSRHYAQATGQTPAHALSG
jgi:transcriptional regulator GlxA family with amidase domain